MPYKSDAQRRFMHAKHPKIARKWDKEEKVSKGKGKDAAIRLGDKLLVPVATGAGGALLANQLPQNQRSSKKALRDIRKNLTPIIKSDDPEFNHEAAQKVADAIMKMDDDSAYMFSRMVMADLLDYDLTHNRRTLQRHLDQTVAKRFERVKKATLGVVAKSHGEESIAYAQALALIEKAYNPQNPYVTGDYQFKESDFRRDRGGRFATKVKVNPQFRSLNDRQAQNLGIPEAGVKLTGAQRKQYQQEYMQVANFLNVVSQSGQLGDHSVFARVENKFGTRPQHWVELDNAKLTPGRHYDPKTERVVAVEAKPTGLTLGGAAFGLAPALGGRNANIVRGVNAADKGFGSFAEEWTARPQNPHSNTDRLYNRVSAASNYLYDVSPDNSKVQMAARVGQAVGSHGREAEKVFGPTARKTAYRYRGTEKKAPDPEMLREFDIAVRNENKVPEVGEDRARIRAARTRALNDALRQKARDFNEGKPPEQQRDWRSFALTAEERTQITRDVGERLRGPEPEFKIETWDSGREIVINHLLDKQRHPSEKLYNLHLDAGNTPPSEGVVIDKTGKIVTQAVGYGDDHYLPFNLKNLKQLRGGEYVRTRSVGGPTSEDIYTGLMAGADRVTVVSRSGVFTVKFAEDFHGGRRYNDKALRMVGRYEKLLDSIQSETIDNVGISPEIRSAIERQVAVDYPNWSGRARRDYVNQRMEEFKHDPDPDLTEEDERAMESHIARETSGMSEQAAAITAGRIRGDWRQEKEYKFRLNGIGYAAALDALQEQFPYYIETGHKPRPDRDTLTLDRDKGYVEHTRNRPTGASEGWHSSRAGTDKFSAADADYQGYFSSVQAARRTGTVTHERPAAPPTVAAPAAPGVAVPAAERPAAAPEAAAAAPPSVTPVSYASEAARAYNAIMDRNPAGFGDQTVRNYPFLAADQRDNFGEWIKDPEHATRFDHFMRTVGPQLRENRSITAEEIDSYNRAAGYVDRQPWDPTKGLFPTTKPMLFTGPEYVEGADQRLVNDAMRTIADRTQPVSTRKSADQMDDDELKEEIRQLVAIRDAVRTVASDPDLRSKQTRFAAITQLDPNHPALKGMLEDPSVAERHIEDIQRLRALNLNRIVPGAAEEQPPGPVRVYAARGALPPGEEQERAQRAEELRQRARLLRQGALALEARGQTAPAQPFHTLADDLERLADAGPSLGDYEGIRDTTEGMVAQANEAIRRRMLGE